MKRILNPIIAILATGLLATSLLAQEDPTVYVTRTGSKYHRATCSYLRKSMIPMKLSEATISYDPCSRCNPPIYKANYTPKPQTKTQTSYDQSSASNTVYITRTGTKYHRSGCSSLSKSRIPIALEKAVLSYEPCSKCKPPILKSTDYNPPSQKDTIKPKTDIKERIIYTGPRGGKYYYNEQGKKVYIKQDE